MADVGGASGLPGGDRFRAIMAAVVPEAVALTDDEWRAAAAIIARAIAARPAGIRRQLALFVRALDLVSLVRHGRVLRAVSTAERTRLLDSLARSRLLALRRGVWGVRTLAFMGFYARPEAARAIGYRASPAGWSARREPSNTE
jgi:hypothetical protein